MQWTHAPSPYQKAFWSSMSPGCTMGISRHYFKSSLALFWLTSNGKQCFDLPAGIDCTAANTAIKVKAINKFFISWLVDVSVNLRKIHCVNNVILLFKRHKKVSTCLSYLTTDRAFAVFCRINDKSDLLYTAKIENLGYNKILVSKHSMDGWALFYANLVHWLVFTL